MLRAQLSDIHFENIGVEDGLSSSFVVSVAQDKFGFMWFATSNGLNRYDGHEFTTFWHDPEDTTTLSGDWIEKILVDHQGNLWVGTCCGLDLFDYETESFSRFQHDPEDPLSISAGQISVIFEDSEKTEVGLKILQNNM